jgi:hypothetical protein
MWVDVGFPIRSGQGRKIYCAGGKLILLGVSDHHAKLRSQAFQE